MTRVQRDIEDVANNAGMWYQVISDTEGYGIIQGNKNTPYEHGFYCIKFTFPKDYPFKPPKCTYKSPPINQNPIFCASETIGISTVCIPQLNTWTSDKHMWLPVYDIVYILRLIRDEYLTRMPLIHDPGFNGNLELATEYTEMVRYSNYIYNLMDLYNRLPMVKNYIDENRCDILKSLKKYEGNEYDYDTVTEYFKIPLRPLT